MPHGITQCHLSPGRGDIPALTPAEAGTRLSDRGGMQGWVDPVHASTAAEDIGSLCGVGGRWTTTQSTRPTFADGAALSGWFADPGAVVELRTLQRPTERQAVAARTVEAVDGARPRLAVVVRRRVAVQARYARPCRRRTDSQHTGGSIRYDTIRDAIPTCARTPTRVSLIYRTEPTTKKCKSKTEKLRVENRYAQK